jgi:hypothetical protein
MAKHPTWAYLYYDRENLWMGFRCEGRPAEELVTAFTDHDSFVWRDDSVEFMLAPGDAAKPFFQIVINSAGSVYDSWAGDKSWDGKLDIQTAKDSAVGWQWSVFVCRVEASITQGGRDMVRQLLSQHPGRREKHLVADQRNVSHYDRFGRVVFGAGIHVRTVERRAAVGWGPQVTLANRSASIRDSGPGSGRQGAFGRRGQVPADGVVPYDVQDDRARRIVLTRETAG